MSLSERKLIILTEGQTEPLRAKTATSLLRYKPEEVVAILDTTNVGATAASLLGVGGDTPVVASLAEAPEANTLAIGIASAGGKIPETWRPVIRQAISSGMDVLSGLHDFVSDDAELVAAAAKSGAHIYDVRKNHERDVASGTGFREGSLRILTVGQDCSVGKMVTSIECSRGLIARGRDSKFVATGQTGIMIEGDGCPVDCVVSDFLNGACEKLVHANQQHDFLMIEGQGSLAHPRYSAVTLGLLHGTRPQGMILCYEAGRPEVNGMPGFPLVPLEQLRQAYEVAGRLLFPTEVIGIGMNTRRLNAEQAAEERERVRGEMGLPACDVFRDGPDELVDAIFGLPTASFRERIRRKSMTQ